MGKLSIQRPEYVSTERVESGAFVTSYRILVLTAVVFLGSLQITFRYTNLLTGAIWVGWLLAVSISLCVNSNIIQLGQMLNYENLSLGSTSLVSIKITR